VPVLKTGSYGIDYLDEGEGPAVVLVHSAASNNRQWRSLVEEHRHRYRFLAVNLFGYGATTPWTAGATQTMADQAGLVEALCDSVPGPVALIGHSFGGAVAAVAAASLQEKIGTLILLEANPFPVLEGADQQAAFDEITGLRGFIRLHGGRGDWDRVAGRFVDYWLGEGAWASLPDDRRAAFVNALPNNYHEWDAIMTMDVTPAAWHSIRANTLLLRARETPRSIRGIYRVLQDLCPHWEYREIAEGGHMAPVTRPDLVNPLCIAFLDRHHTGAD